MCRSCHERNASPAPQRDCRDAGAGGGARAIRRRGALALGGAAAGAGLLALNGLPGAIGVGYAQTPPRTPTPAVRPTPRAGRRVGAAFDASKVALPQQFPAWADGQGWEQPDKFLTIGLGDIDKDGQAEIIGRGPDGLQTWRWDTSTNLWQRMGGTLPLSDADGWDLPQYYSSIRLVDVDGDGAAELVTRSSAGLQVYAWDKGAATWSTLGSVFTEFSDANGWNQPQYYETFRFAPLNGPQRQLIARSSGGIGVWSWSSASLSWVQLGGTLTAFSDAIGWDQVQYYSTIRLADVNNDRLPELIARDSNGLVVYQWGGTSSAWTLTQNTGLLTDSGGWNFPQNYLTIQFADIDGDGADELLARAGTGLLAYKWLATATAAAEVGFYSYSNAIPFSDADGWNSEVYFASIQAADVNNDGRAEVIARATDGLGAWAFTPPATPWVPGTTGTFAQLGTYQGVMSDADGWNAPQSYLTIQTADVDGDQAFEVVGKAPDGLRTFKWSAVGAAHAVPILPATPTPLPSPTPPRPPATATAARTATPPAATPPAAATPTLPPPPGASPTAAPANTPRPPPSFAPIEGPTVVATAVPTAANTPRPPPPFAPIEGPTVVATARPAEPTAARPTEVPPPDVPIEGPARVAGGAGADLGEVLRIVLAGAPAQQGAPTATPAPPPPFAPIERATVVATARPAEPTAARTPAPPPPDAPIQGPTVVPTATATARPAPAGPSATASPPAAASGTATGTAAPASPPASPPARPTDTALPATATAPPPRITPRPTPPGGPGFRTQAGGPGFLQPPIAGFPAYSGGQLTAYQLLSQYLLTGVASISPWPTTAAAPSAAYQDVRAQYTNQELQGQWLFFYQAVAGLQGKPPAGVAAADFEAVRTQLQTELAYVNLTNLWFANLRAFLTELFDEDQMSVNIVADYLNLSPTDPTNVVIADLEVALTILGGILGTIGSFGVDSAAIAGAVIGLLATAFQSGSSATGGSDELSLQVAQVQARLLTLRENGLRGNDLNQAAFLTHWPLLQALGAPIASLQVGWPLGQVDTLAAGARRGYEIALWKTLTPAIWSVQSTFSSSGFGGYPPAYIYHWTPDGAFYPTCDSETQSAWLAQGNEIPNQAGLSRLFDQPDPGDPTGPLGASMYDVMNGYNGWAMTGSLNNECGPQAPPPDPAAVRLPRLNPAPIRS